MESRLELRAAVLWAGLEESRSLLLFSTHQGEEYGLVSLLRLFGENHLSHNPFNIHSLLFSFSLPTSICICS